MFRKAVQSEAEGSDKADKVFVCDFEVGLTGHPRDDIHLMPPEDEEEEARRRALALPLFFREGVHYWTESASISCSD